MHVRLILIAVLLLCTFRAAAQERCGTTEYEKVLQQRNPDRASLYEFENWVLKLRSQKQGQQTLARQVYRIPVVVHVVHNGEAVGTGTNIPFSQIERQIQILNQDFQKQNTAQISQLPPDFQALAASVELEFVLARQDPEGQPTDGIVRVQGEKTAYAMADDIPLKNLTHWPSQDYLNLYSVALQGNLLGYAQFPDTREIDGLDDVGFRSEATDGVVIHYRYFGEGGNAAAESQGRTATHEIGHYLGLRHIWGDKAGCDTDDYVDDTPLQDDSYQSCPGSTAQSCGSPDMYQNFLDYTPDNCMALFTQGQAARMRLILENSPDRKSLLSSHALEEPVQLANDAGLRNSTYALTDVCTRTFTASFELRNYGTSTLNSASIDILLNGQLIETLSLSNLNLNTKESRSLVTSPIQPTAPGQNLLQLRVSQANGLADQNEVNNLQEVSFFVPHISEPPALYTFENGLDPLYTINPDSYYTWHTQTYINEAQTPNTAVLLNFYDYEINFGALDLLLSPKYDLRAQTEAYLMFRLAHAQYGGSSQDGLEIYVSTDCSEDLSTATRIFQKRGSELASAPSTDTPFVPLSDDHWRTEYLDLSAYAGMANVQLIFVGLNDYGNNLYLDDIELLDQPPPQHDLALRQIQLPSVVSAEQNPELALNLRNAGLEPVQGVRIRYSLDGESVQEHNLPELQIPPQTSINITPIQFTTLPEGLHRLHVTVHSLDGAIDLMPENNRREQQFIISTAQDYIPLRERFRESDRIPETWSSISPDPAKTGWEIQKATSNEPGNLAAVASFFGEKSGFEKWLVSPILDLSESLQAGLQFRYAYALIPNTYDALQVRASTDGGRTYPDVLFDRAGAALSESRADTRWAPSRIEEWDTTFINLERYLGESQLRIAFVALSGGGNDVYLDDIEFIPSATRIDVRVPDENDATLYPNPTQTTWKLVFNLPEREDILLRIINANGRLLRTIELPLTLNQVHQLYVDDLPAGLYYLHIQGKSLNKVIRGLIAR
jgi:hypothetical protein